MADAVYAARDAEAHSHIPHLFDGMPPLSEWRADGHRQRVRNLHGSMALEPKGFLRVRGRALRVCARRRRCGGRERWRGVWRLR
jgi:hypothetical protein